MSRIFKCLFYLAIGCILTIASANALALVDDTDASSAIVNPASLTRLDHQQIVLFTNLISSNVKFAGTAINILPRGQYTQSGEASSSRSLFLPGFAYAVPINSHVTAGVALYYPPFFNSDVTFADNSVVRYNSTRATTQLIDLTPSVGVKLNDRLRVGFGLDIEHANFDFNSMLRTNAVGTNDASIDNTAGGYGYGWHAGLGYKLARGTLVGLSYRSQVAMTLTGESKAQAFVNGQPAAGYSTDDFQTKVRVPAKTELHFIQYINPDWRVKAVIAYAQWGSIKNINLRNVALPNGTIVNSNKGTNYDNVWEYALFNQFNINKQIRLSILAGLMNSYLPNANVIPIGGIGGFIQASKNIGLSLDYTHFFEHSYPAYALTPANNILNGTMRRSADAFLAKIIWNIA